MEIDIPILEVLFIPTWPLNGMGARFSSAEFHCDDNVTEEDSDMNCLENLFEEERRTYEVQHV